MRRRTPPLSTVRIETVAHEVLVESAVQGREVDVLRAKAFAKVDASNHFITLECASVGEYGLRIGYGSRQAREYAAAGRVMRLAPLAEQMLLEGQVCVSTLAIIEPFFVEPELRPLDEDGEPMSFQAILEWARLLPDQELRKTVNRRKAEVRIDGPVHSRTVHLSNQGAEDLERTQVIVSQQRKRSVSYSEAAERALRYFVEKHYLLEKTPRKRRLPAMPPRLDGTRNPRSVAAEVKRALMAKHGDVCAIEFCENKIWLENAHHLPHALGGGNEEADQDHICTSHHGMKDSGQIVWVPDPKEPGGGYYRSAKTGAILRLKPPILKRELPRKPPRAPPCMPSEGDPSDRVREGAVPLVASRASRIGSVSCGNVRRGNVRRGNVRRGNVRRGNVRRGNFECRDVKRARGGRDRIPLDRFRTNGTRYVFRRGLRRGIQDGTASIAASVLPR